MDGYLVIVSAGSAGVEPRTLDAAVGMLAAAGPTACGSAGEPVRHNVDGELGAEPTDRRYRVLPAAWSLLAAPAATSPGPPR